MELLSIKFNFHSKHRNRGRTDGRHPIFSPEDKDLESWNWNYDNKGYARISRMINGKMITIFAHRIVLERACGPKPDHLLSDHINRNRNDNRRENLRYATARENNLNRERTYLPSKDRYYGVVKHNDGRFKAVFKRKYLGLFTTKEEARDVVINQYLKLIALKSDGK